MTYRAHRFRIGKPELPTGDFVLARQSLLQTID